MGGVEGRGEDVPGGGGCCGGILVRSYDSGNLGRGSWKGSLKDMFGHLSLSLSNAAMRLI